MFRNIHSGPTPVLPVAEERVSFFSARDRRSGGIGTSRGLWLLLFALAMAAPVAAQYPGRIVGRVTDGLTHAPVEGAALTVIRTSHTTMTDAAGRYDLRGPGPGTWRVRVQRIGYAPLTLDVELREGEIRTLDITLQPVVHALPGIEAMAPRSLDRVRIDRESIERSGARTAGDALGHVTGVVVRSTGPGSAQEVSIRGAAADATLVLVDGVPLNDPVTGVADLSTIDASRVESMEIIAGGASARFGARAQAGAILIETRRAANADRHLEAGIGSLGMRRISLAWAGEAGLPWMLGAAWETLEGAYAFDMPPEVGGGSGVRENADARSLGAWAGTSLQAGSGRLDLRVAHDALDRGLPGRAFAPSTHARQAYDRTQVSATWRALGADRGLLLNLAASRQHIRHRDSAPPFGEPYDDTTRAWDIQARADFSRHFDRVSLGLGAELRHQHIEGTALSANARKAIDDAGVLAHAEWPLAVAGGQLTIAAQVRADRDPWAHDWVGSHSLTVGWSTGAFAAHVAHRSSYSPPTLGDRYFREGVGIAPNPDLRAERVPGEIEAAVRFELSRRVWRTALRATAYRGDIEDMILWAPDFRFIWSPYNADAKRSGIETGVQLISPGGLLQIDGGWTYARATYDRERDDDVQIAYRPRHTGFVAARVAFGRTRVLADVRYTGERTTAPSRVNMLGGFWTLNLGLAHTRAFHSWETTLDLRVDRVLDEKDALIFAFPDPGRVFRAAIRLTPGR